MTDNEEIRAAGLSMAVDAYGCMESGSDLGEQLKQILATAIVFSAYIEDGHGEAMKIVRGDDKAINFPGLHVVHSAPDHTSEPERSER